MQWIQVGLFLAIPLLLNLAAVRYLRGGYRIVACLPLLVLALAYGLDLVSVAGRGNLAGLFTMIAAGPSLGLLVVVLAARLIAWLADRLRRGQGGSGDAAGPEGPPGITEGEEAEVAGSWKVNCRRTAPGGSGSANGEFSRMAEAVAFAEGWMGPGWTATITNPQGERVELVKGKRPVFPGGPGRVDGGGETA